MLKNDYLVAKIGVDTAENEPFQVVTALEAELSKAGELHGIEGSRRHVGRVQAENLARLLRHRGLGARRRAPMRETAAWKLADSSQPPILYVRRSFTSTREHHTSFA